jgi:hypothetical protein
MKPNLPDDKDEFKDWESASVLSLSRAYGEGEPDYENIPVTIKNPDFDPKHSKKQ